MKKLLFVVNGHSGKGQIKNKLLDIIDTVSYTHLTLPTKLEV